MDFMDIEAFLILLMSISAILALVIGFFRKNQVLEIIGWLLILLIFIIGNVFRFPDMSMPPPKPFWAKNLLLFSSCFLIAGYLTQYRLEKYLIELSKDETTVLSDDVTSNIERSGRLSILLLVIGLLSGTIGIFA